MTDGADVLAAAEARALALTESGDDRLRELLHPQFVWTSHLGERFDRDGYLASNQHGRNVWFQQQLHDVQIQVVGDVAVLTCVAEDLVDTGTGQSETFTMPMTQTWVRSHASWQCLAGHAGPRLDPTSHPARGGRSELDRRSAESDDIGQP